MNTTQRKAAFRSSLSGTLYLDQLEPSGEPNKKWCAPVVLKDTNGKWRPDMWYFNDAWAIEKIAHNMGVKVQK